MNKRIPFIARKKELKHIDELIKDRENSHLIFIHGDGGIGKTRLLQELSIRYSNNCEYLSTEIIDFDDKRYHLSENIGEKIAGMLDRSIFEPYLIALIDYRKMEIAGVNPEALQNKFEECNQIFISCFNKFSDSKKVLLFIDTIEALSDNDYWDFLIKMTKYLNNYIVIIAGRNADYYGKHLQSELGERQIHLIKLQPLTENDAEEYLRYKQKKLSNNKLTPEISKKIISLSHGRPILIDLAIERLSRDIPFEWLYKDSDLTQHDKTKEFERELVIDIAQCRTQRDSLILLMAHVYPLNDSLISTLLDLDDDQSKKLYNETKRLCFIKCMPNGYIKLHDEMQRMIDEYVWNEADIEGDWRVRWSRVAVNYYINKIQSFEQQIADLAVEEKNSQKEPLKYIARRWPLIQEKRVFIVERLRHTLFLNIEDGFILFIDLFDEATQKPQFSLRDMLLVQMHSYIKDLSFMQLYELNSRHAKHLMDRGHYIEAKDKIKYILKEIKDISPSQKVEMLILLGNIKMRLGRESDGVENFEEAVKVCEDNKFEEQQELRPTVMRVRNALGWGYRKTMKYEDAIKQYRSAFELSVFLNERLEEAKIMNNLAYAYAKKGDTSVAHNLAKEAKELWIELDNKEGLGSLSHAYSEIYNQEDNLNESIRHSRKALEIFEELEHNDWIERLCSELGKYYWERADMNLAKSDLKEVEDDLNKAEKILNKVSKGQYKIEALHYRGHVYITRYIIYNNMNFIDKAEELFELAYKESKINSSYPMLLNSMGDLVYIAMKKDDNKQIEKFEREYKSFSEEFLKNEHIKGEEGILLKYFGDFYLCKKSYHKNDIDKAFQYYMKAIPLISKYKERTSYSLMFQIKDIQKRIGHSPCLAKVKIELGKKLSELWRTDLGRSHIEALGYFIRWQKGTE